jgi:hypothetical protein
MAKRKQKPPRKTQRPNKEIEQALQGLVINLLGGKKDEVSVPITLTLPRGLYNAYVAVAKQYNLPLEGFLQSAASEGIKTTLSINPKTEDPLQLAQKEGFDISGIQEGMSKIQNLAKQMEQLQELFDARLNPKDPT